MTNIPRAGSTESADPTERAEDARGAEPRALPRLLDGPEHFAVDELLAYALCGSGEHLYVQVEKCDLTTDMLVAALAKAAGCSPRSVGFAGRKDRRAVTRQWLSLAGCREESLVSLEERTGGRARVVATTRHRNKLRLGHLRGNRFRLQLAVADTTDMLGELESRLAEFERCGLPNRFGSQRFGRHGSTLRIAQAVANRQPLEAVRWLIDPTGRWKPSEPLPPGRRRGLEGRVRASLERAPTDGEAALRAAGRSFHLLVSSAAQAAIFNAVLEARSAEGWLHTAREGDVARKRGAGAFVCREPDLADINRRAAPGVLEVVMTGPLPGTQRLSPGAAMLEVERAWSSSTGVSWDWFAHGGPLESPGERRGLVEVFLEPPRIERTRPGVATLEVALPAGCYATELLRSLGVRLPRR